MSENVAAPATGNCECTENGRVETMKYGDRVERPDGSIYFSLPMSNTEQVGQFMDEIGEIGNAEIDVDIFTVPEETFYSGNLTSRQMSILLWMIDQPKTKSEKAKE